MLSSLLQSCITQSQLEREGRTGTPPAGDFPGAAALAFPVPLEAVRLEKMSEAASFSLSLAPGWGAGGSWEIPGGQSSSGNTFSKCVRRWRLILHGSCPHTPTCERPHPFQVHSLPASPRSWEVKLQAVKLGHGSLFSLFTRNKRKVGNVRPISYFCGSL